MRSSSYNIYIKLENSTEYDFIAHGYTGALNLINKNIAKWLENSKGYLDYKGINNSTVETLKNRGFITSMEKTEEYDYVKKIAEYLHKKNIKKKAFLFAITQDCNFRCTYCFENSYSKNGNDWSKNRLTKQLVDKAYKAMLEIEIDRSKHSDNISLYGGEPLLKENYEIVKYIVEKGKQRNYNFGAITNGYDLDTYIHLLGKGKIETLQITIDGLEERHNTRRKHKQHGNSFAKIIDNIGLSLDTGVKIGVRINVDASNFDEVAELLRFFREKGWFKLDNFNAYIANTQRGCASNDISDDTLSQIEFVEKTIEIKKSDPFADLILVSDSLLEKSLDVAINHNKIMEYKSSFCGAHTGMYIFDPNGDIYPCWDVFGNKDHIIAKYKDKVVFTDANTRWNNRIISNISTCRKCKYALTCGGGCVSTIAQTYKELNKPNCMDHPKVFSKIVNEYYDNHLKKQI